MILPQDAIILAITKLKTRRIRLIVTLVIASLLFIILATVSLLVNGTFFSIERFSEEGLGKRYIIQAQPADSSSNFIELYSEPELIAEAKRLHSKQQAEKSALAKELGIEYDPRLDVQPVESFEPNNGETLNSNSPMVMKLVYLKLVESTKSFDQKLANMSQEYGATALYESYSLGVDMGEGSSSSTNFSIVINGEEKLEQDNKQLNFNQTGFESIQNGVTAISDGLITPFILPGQSSDSAQTIPIVAPQSAAEQILGLNPLSQDVSSEEKLTRLKELRQSISNLEFDVCLRNQASLRRQTEAIQMQADIKANSKKDNFVMPELVYEISKTPCQDVTITRDVRSAYQKELALKQQKFKQAFDEFEIPAEQRLVKFRLVGITADPPSSQSFRVSDIITNILASNIGLGWMIPISAVEKIPEFANEISDKNEPSSFWLGKYVEFPTAKDARNFIKEQSCKLDDSFIADLAKECDNQGKPYFLMPFGSSSIALEEMRSSFNNFFSKFLFSVVIVSALILMGTIGKVIADSRRETAVFRAIGAKRFDIAQIYLTYALILGFLISGISLSVGFLISNILQNRYGPEISVDAVVAFNASDLTKEFKLVGFNWSQLSLLGAIIILGVIMSTIIPLLSNLRRNPIKDMRDER